MKGLRSNPIKRLTAARAIPVLTVGAIWGIFEATVGYALHLLPVSIGFLVWYPVAVFFLMAAYRVTGQKTAILGAAALAGAVKLLNLLLPGRVDRVINPAVSIWLEGAAVFAAALLWERTPKAPGPGRLLLLSLGMNTLWRTCYLGYLAFLVPDWMREVSVLKSSEALLRFLLIDNSASSLVVLLGLLAAAWLSRRGPRRMLWRGAEGRHAPGWLTAGLLALNIALQMAL